MRCCIRWIFMHFQERLFYLEETLVNPGFIVSDRSFVNGCVCVCVCLCVHVDGKLTSLTVLVSRWNADAFKHCLFPDKPQCQCLSLQRSGDVLLSQVLCSVHINIWLIICCLRVNSYSLVMTVDAMVSNFQRLNWSNVQVFFSWHLLLAVPQEQSSGGCVTPGHRAYRARKHTEKWF